MYFAFAIFLWITMPAPPATKTDPVIDEYQSAGSAGPVKVTDNYRWLEDGKSPETRAYIAAQNAYTKQYLDQVKILPRVREQMAALLRVDFVGTPQKRETGTSSRSGSRRRIRLRFICAWVCMAPMSG